MPVKNPSRRSRAVARRTSRRGNRDEETTHRIRGGISKAFITITAFGFVGFVIVLCQLYRAVHSQQGLDLGAVRFRLNNQLRSTTLGLSNALETVVRNPDPQFLASRFSFSTTGVHLDRISTGARDADQSKSAMQDVTVFPASIANNFPARSRTLLSEGRLEGTRMQATSEPTGLIQGCRWTEHVAQYLGGFASPGTVEQGESLAKEDCIKQGKQNCAGVTCSSSRLVCSARAGDPYLAPSPENEVSFTMDCGDDENSDKRSLVEPDLPTLPPDFVVSEIDTSVFQMNPPGLRRPLEAGRAALVIIAHNRPDCLKTCLRTIVVQDGVDIFKLVVSLDDPPSFPKMEDALKEFQVTREIVVWRKPVETLKTAVQKIAAHFRFAISQSFDENNFEFAIFLENDLTLAPDALWYFRSTAWLLEEDQSLFCVSAWNDNGFKGLVSDEKRIFRTDYFPGLGWMIHQNTWRKIKRIWPRNPMTGWDHWLRHGSGLRPRECVVPEISRTHHFDTKGTNVKAGSGIAKLLEKMATSTLPSGELRITPELLKDSYEDELKNKYLQAEITSQSGLDFMKADKTYLLPYAREDYKNIAKKLDIYGAQPRTAHRGMIITRHPKNHAVVVLVDRRQDNGFLKEVDVWKPHPKRRIGSAQKGQSCDQFCRSHHMRCDPRELEFVNHCSVLKKYFACENGCGHQVGLEIPCYVHDPVLDTALQCLVTDEALSTCQAAHKSTTRMCACIP